MEDFRKFADLCSQAARLGGTILLEYRHKFSAREKAPRDLVTDADVAAESAIRAFLESTCPGFDFVGEESSALHDQASDHSPKPDSLDGPTTSAMQWLVDPLDGTTNYIHGLHSYATSVALTRNGRTIAGAVYDPLLDEMYLSYEGGDAQLNGQSIRASGRGKLGEALVVCSFPPGVRRDDPEIERFIAVLERARSVRRLGSASLNLCYIAAGRLDAYWATSVRAWDVAAGCLIAQQAGATVRHLDGSQLELDDPRILVAASQSLWNEMFDALSDIELKRT